MKLMITIAHEYLQQKGEATFKQIFDEVKKQQKDVWKQIFVGQTMDKIEIKKGGELHTYLTTDGRFIMTDDKKWALVADFTYEDVQKMKMNIGENHEE